MTRRSHIDRRALFASGAAATLLAATGVSAGPGPLRGGRIRIALSGSGRNDSFDASKEQGLFMHVASVGAVFDTLTEIAADGTLRGELATGWQGSPDAHIWTLQLREGVQFHDGTAFSPADVVATFERHLGDLLSDVVGLETVGAYTLRVELAASDPDFAYRLSDPRLVIFPARNIEQAMEQGIGTGLYRVHQFVPGRQFIGLRVAHHYKDGQSGWFDSVELVGLSSDAVRAEALRDNYVDAADLSHTADLGDLEGIRVLPEEHFMNTAADHCLAMPMQVGTRWPLDNLRAAERWWMA